MFKQIWIIRSRTVEESFLLIKFSGSRINIGEQYWNIDGIILIMKKNMEIQKWDKSEKIRKSI